MNIKIYKDLSQRIILILEYDIILKMILKLLFTKTMMIINKKNIFL